MVKLLNIINLCSIICLNANTTYPFSDRKTDHFIMNEHLENQHIITDQNHGTVFDLGEDEPLNLIALLQRTKK